MAKNGSGRQTTRRATQAGKKTTARGNGKRVKSDLKDVVPARAGAAFPHDREQRHSSRKDRHPEPRGSRSDHVPRATSRGANEQRGGTERTERKRRAVDRSAVAARA